MYRCFFFVCKQKTAYEMRISDWSSDVCSSDLKARAEGLAITHIFETHRNEDLVSGAPVLAEMTGAKVLHGPNADGEVVYAQTTREGDSYRNEIGRANV